MTTRDEHRALAEQLYAEAQDDYAELRAVPKWGRSVHWGRDGTGFEGRYSQTQTERRDELGKSIMGKYAAAQLHATLALSAPELPSTKHVQEMLDALNNPEHEIGQPIPHSSERKFIPFDESTFDPTIDPALGKPDG